jgi:hypothetical protein
MSDAEKRKAVRVPFRADILIHHGKKMLHLGGDSLNVSMSGMLVETHEKLDIGSPCRVLMSLSGTQEPIELAIEGRVVRQGATGFGIHFEKMDLDSYTLLKEIVRHNVEDPDSI